jgi:drug/metabolite transporter (DMT)-like permease
MSDRLTLSQVALLTAYAVGMAAGQVLFKMAATQSRAEKDSAAQQLMTLWHNAHFISAMVLYAVLAILWVWILSFTPLSRAYPFVALTFVLTVAFGGLFFGEPISPRLLLGLVLVGGGLLLVVG